MAGRIPDSFIDDLLARIDIVDLIESYVPLRKAGKDFQALCPFHDEKTPSFTISRDKQFYHCFGCSAHGSAIGFLMNYRNLEFVEAVEELAGIAGVEVPREAGRARPAGTRELYGVLERARAFYETQLRQHPDRERAVAYLKNRGISGQVAKQFRLGYAPDGWRNLVDALTADGVTEEQLERSGLVSKRERGGWYDRFRDRVVFPIHDRRGRVVGFGGRVIDQGEPKYLNSPETELFHKGRELYGLHEALALRQDLDRLVVVEGYMDVIALHQFGLGKVVATLGTAVTPDHLELLFRHTAEVAFCFDGDTAGKRAAWKALETALPLMDGNRQVRFVFLPDGHDPDSAVREFGPDGLFERATTFGLSDYLLQRLGTEMDLSGGEGRARLVERARPYLMKIPSDGHRGAGIRRLSELTGIDERVLRQDLLRGRRGPAGGAPRPAGELVRFTSRSLEGRALALLLQQPALATCLDEATAAFLAEELPGCALLLDAWSRARARPDASTAALLERWRGEEAEDRLAELATLDLNLEPQAREQELRDAIVRLSERAEDRRFRRLTALPLAELTPEQREVLRDYQRRRAGAAPP